MFLELQRPCITAKDTSAAGARCKLAVWHGWHPVFKLHILVSCTAEGRVGGGAPAWNERAGGMWVAEAPFADALGTS